MTTPDWLAEYPVTWHHEGQWHAVMRLTGERGRIIINCDQIGYESFY